MSVAVREFRSNDCAEVLRLWERAEGIGLSDADSPDGIGSFLDRNPGLSVVVVDGGALIGTLLCGHDWRRGLIHDLVVRASRRRRGLGRQLVHRALAAHCEQGIAKCHLLVLRDNAQVRGFWQGIGGEEHTSLTAFSRATRTSH